MLKGNVTAKVETYRLGLASELLIAWQRERQYKKLAHSTENNSVSLGHTEKFRNQEPNACIDDWNQYRKRDQESTRFCKSLILLAATSPMSSRKTLKYQNIP